MIRILILIVIVIAGAGAILILIVIVRVTSNQTAYRQRGFFDAESALSGEGAAGDEVGDGGACGQGDQGGGGPAGMEEAVSSAYGQLEGISRTIISLICKQVGVGGIWCWRV